MRWLIQIWHNIWNYLITKDRDRVLAQMIKETREQTISEPSKHKCPKTGLTIVDKLPARQLKIKKKRKANGRTRTENVQ